MKIIEIAALPNGAHRNQTFHGNLPDGWAVVPEDMELENFPFGVVTAEEVVQTREVPKYDEFDGAFLEYETDPESPSVMTVTGWEPLPIPEPEPKPEPEPSTDDILNALLGVNA